MQKKLTNISSFIMLFVLFGIVTYCIFDGSKVSAKDKKSISKKTSDTVYVDIKGAVNNPGVYEVYSNSRVIDVIKEAGDFTDDADTSIINLSKKVSDEMYIIVYTKDEMNSYKERFIPTKTIIKEVEKKIMCPDTENDACLKDNNTSFEGKININSASKEELESLPGIGSSKADAILEYRENNTFNSIEDIKNVTGIGDSLYEKIKDNIEV